MEIPKNPLYEYKELTGMSWEEMSAKTQISVPQLFRISRMSPEELQNIKLSTVLFLHWKLHVDLHEYIMKYLFPEIYQRK